MMSKSTYLSKQPLFPGLPNDLYVLIFEFDSTFLSQFNKVIRSLNRNRNKRMFDKFLKLDMGFTIRNYEKPNGVLVPRYFDIQRQYIVPSFLRQYLL